MLAALSVLMLLPRAGALEETTTSSIGEPEDSERSCLLQKKDFAASLQPSEIGENLCNEGEICSCESNPSNPSEFLQDRLLSDCIQNCEGKAGFTWRTYGAANSQCWCCDELEIDIHTLDDNTPEDFWKEYAVYPYLTSSDSGVEGDPHIKTLDGHHYTLLKQGTFSLWHFSGVDAEASHEVKKVPVDWQIYGHYSGSQSFTKGLLLVDKSGGSVQQVLELTSQDCVWRAHGSKDWTAVSDGPISVPSAGTEFLLSKKTGVKGYNHVRLNFKTQEGKTEVAVLSLSCRPHHSINLELVMKKRSDNRFVDGELKTGRRDFSELGMLQTSKSGDSEFAVQDSWQSLGGSEQAALYLEMDQAEAAPVTLMSTPCAGEAEVAAKEICSKHLGDVEHSNDKDQSLFQDCVYDLCHGADETVAELAAELRDSTRAI